MKRMHHEWFDGDYVLRLFGSTDVKARRAYLVFLEEEMGIDRESELSGGGLVRSHGGWSKVLSMRKQGLKEQGDERIPGSGLSITESASHAVLRNNSQFNAKGMQDSLDGFKTRVCADP